jgi:transposase
MTEAVARDHGVEVKVMHKEGRKKGTFEPIQPLWKVEDAFAQLGRSGRLARSFEGTEASATAWLQVACVGYLLTLV